MRYINLLAALVLSFALIGTAACASSDEDMSGTAGEVSDDGSAAGGDLGTDPDPAAGDKATGPGDGSVVGGKGGVTKPGKGGAENDLAIQVLSAIASKSLPAELNLDMLLEMVRSMDNGVAEILANHIAELAADGDATGVALVGGEMVSGEDVSLMLNAFIQTLGSGAGGDLGSGTGRGTGDANLPPVLEDIVDNTSDRTAVALLIDACDDDASCEQSVTDLAACVAENLDDLPPLMAQFGNAPTNPMRSTFPTNADVQTSIAYCNALNASTDDDDGSVATNPQVLAIQRVIDSLPANQDFTLAELLEMVGPVGEPLVAQYMGENPDDAIVAQLASGGTATSAEVVTFLEAVIASN